MPKYQELVQLNKDSPFRENTTGMSPEDRRGVEIEAHCGNIKALSIGIAKGKPDGSGDRPYRH